jgi:hypothetical protein
MDHPKNIQIEDHLSIYENELDIPERRENLIGEEVI